MNAHKIAIIGGGPAGLMAAEVLGRAGKTVTIYERMASAGRKFLMAGRGGLNLTHSQSLEDFLEHYGESQGKLAPIVEDFPPDALLAWVHDLGQETFVGSSGRVFPKSLKTSPLLRSWLARLDQYDVRIVPRREWVGWDDANRLLFRNPEGEIAAAGADATILALGGASWPRLGSDGSWVERLSSRGVGVSPLRPANCGFIADWTDVFRRRFEGQPLKNIALRFGSHSSRGEAMITASGIEGGAVYALSSYIRDTIDHDGRAVLTIDLCPDVPLSALVRRLEAPRRGQSLANYLRKAVGLAPIGINLLREAAGLALPTESHDLASLIKAVPLTLIASQPLARAISTAGGIRWGSLDEHLMLHAIPGVFVAGEMLDWEAPTGGYLLQACFSTGVAAAQGVLRWLPLNEPRLNVP